MAILSSTGFLTKSSGNVVYRKYRGLNIMQKRPKKFKQTQATVECSTDFGVASASGLALRTAFSALHHNTGHDGGMVNRMTSVAYQALRRSQKALAGQRDLHDAPLEGFVGFQFNVNSPLNKALLIKPVVSRGEQGEVIVELPQINAKQDIVTPFDRVSRHRIRLLLIAFNLRGEFCEFTGEAIFEVPNGGSVAAQRFVFDNEVPKGCMLMLGMTMTSLRTIEGEGDYLLNNKEFNPAAIIAAFAGSEEREDISEEELKERVSPERAESICGVDYNGNHILNAHAKRLLKAIPSTARVRESPSRIHSGPPDLIVGKRMTLKRG
jgi:hypothetical protein